MRRAEDIGWTLVLLVLGMITLVLAAVSGGALHEALAWIGLSHLASDAWAIARFPIAAGLALIAIAIVHWAAPTTQRRHFHLVTPGGLLSVAAWMISTVGFSSTRPTSPATTRRTGPSRAP